MSVLISLLSGVIMGLGLAISGMINPAKVLNFLDLAGVWDPTLAVVMGAHSSPPRSAIDWCSAENGRYSRQNICCPPVAISMPR